MYKCVKCGHIMEELSPNAECTYCGYNVLVKIVPFATVKRVEAR